LTKVGLVIFIVGVRKGRLVAGAGVMKENADHKENEEKEWASSSGARCVLCVGILLFLFYSGWIPKEARGETNGWSAAAESGHQDNGLEIKLCCAS
jgi:hypothetical protein